MSNEGSGFTNNEALSDLLKKWLGPDGDFSRVRPKGDPIRITTVKPKDQPLKMLTHIPEGLHPGLSEHYLLPYQQKVIAQSEKMKFGVFDIPGVAKEHPMFPIGEKNPCGEIPLGPWQLCCIKPLYEAVSDFVDDGLNLYRPAS